MNRSLHPKDTRSPEPTAARSGAPRRQLQSKCDGPTDNRSPDTIVRRPGVPTVLPKNTSSRPRGSCSREPTEQPVSVPFLLLLRTFSSATRNRCCGPTARLPGVLLRQPEHMSNGSMGDRSREPTEGQAMTRPWLLPCMCARSMDTHCLEPISRRPSVPTQRPTRTLPGTTGSRLREPTLGFQACRTRPQQSMSSRPTGSPAAGHTAASQAFQETPRPCTDWLDPPAARSRSCTAAAARRSRV